jgi:hypothetical protein
MSLRSFLAAMAVLGAGSACPTSALARAAPVPYWSFHGQLNWGLVEPTESVIRNQSEFQELWTAIHSTPARGRGSLPRPPQIDFRKEMIIAVGTGRRSSGGYRIKVERIEDVGDRLRVHYSTYGPGSNCMTTQSITSPVELVRLQKNRKPVAFAEHHETQDCPK